MSKNEGGARGVKSEKEKASNCFFEERFCDDSLAVLNQTKHKVYERFCFSSLIFIESFSKNEFLNHHFFAPSPSLARSLMAFPPKCVIVRRHFISIPMPA
jgi:hypothetical protein